MLLARLFQASAAVFATACLAALSATAGAYLSPRLSRDAADAPAPAAVRDASAASASIASMYAFSSTMEFGLSSGMGQTIWSSESSTTASIDESGGESCPDRDRAPPEEEREREREEEREERERALLPKDPLSRDFSLF